MVQIKVLDTGVLIGMCIEIDQHHTKCFDYVVEDDCKEIYITPTVGSEFKRISKVVRQKLSQSIGEHRQKVVREFNDEKLGRDRLRYIRDSVLDSKNRSYRFLYEYYSEKLKNRVSVDKLEILMDLNDMETEVWMDACQEYGGWKSFVSGWNKGIDTYSDVEKDLLVCEGDDPHVCLEAHHVAVNTGKVTELGTTNPRHFIDKRVGEPESRKDNILRITDLRDVKDLSCDKVPTGS